MTLSYSVKVSLVRYLSPLIVILPCAIYGYHAARSLFAQAPPQSHLAIITSQAVYHSGEIVTATLANSSDVNVFVVNNCPNNPLAVYRQVQGRWVRITATAPIAICAGDPSTYEIPASSKLTTDYRHWPSLFTQPGLYRIVFTPEFYTQGASVDFRVVR
ncbi:MAG TPA: hypothetical protein VGS08_06030 [Candidatus Saccharimonadales bacterium]|nr:hypothetical protein [Candidatus Saccharimonadales bacterium]